MGRKPIDSFILNIPFNKPYLTGKEVHYIYKAVQSGWISGDGEFTKKCHAFFEKTFGFQKVLLTNSCTNALEMAALLLDIKPGDEVIVPSFTFVSTANAFALRGATIRFVDSEPERPHLDASKIESLIGEKTRAIVPVHYGGTSCNMEEILWLSEKHDLSVIEDAAQAINGFWKEKPLGSLGQLAAFSFHETKNVMSGEGGMLVVNDGQFAERAEIIREKGTNRSAFFKGEVNQYEWVDIGSSFLPSDVMAAFLYSQLEQLDAIQLQRKMLWNLYRENLKPLEDKGVVSLPFIPDYSSNNAHVFYLVCQNKETRDKLINFLKTKGIMAVFHYLPLHQSPYFKDKYKGKTLPNAVRFSDCLVRLPLFFELTKENVARICKCINTFFN
ncbi:dTDP-4-amino-4,6-dideoxygalactose transaminase [Flexithrix dorotheae]|uniref:dTDP-4-amino-4,6-dideoxygalactose transaminase n=1 Tax=Flexithrix dorotheae TaxID=70993 RepID=UPI0003743F42|nr:dTDP-4-amino-4,6-dideoxygalactose transaminase [Flexithrix dorotheae]